MLFIIVNRNDEKKVINTLKKYKVGFKIVVYGKGTATESILSYFGLNDEEKSIMRAKEENILNKLKITRQ